MNASTGLANFDGQSEYTSNVSYDASTGQFGCPSPTDWASSIKVFFLQVRDAAPANEYENNGNQDQPRYNDVARAKRDYSKLGRKNFQPPPS